MATANVAFSLLCGLLESVRSTLPQTLVFYAAGQSDLCHGRWDHRFEAWKQSSANLGDELASKVPADQYATFVFWLDELLANHRVHHCWSHVLDGKCLWDLLREGADNLLFNVLWAMSLTLAGWLRTVSRGSQRRLVRIVCVCNAGKHRSVLLSRMLLLVFQIVFQLLGRNVQDDHGFRWVWAAGARVHAELEAVKAGSDLHEAKRNQRQSHVVVKNVKKVFLHSDMVKHLQCMNISDGVLRLFRKEDYVDDKDYVLDTYQFLWNARSSGQTPGVRAWVADLLESGTSVHRAIQAVNLDRDWIAVMDHVLLLFPRECSLCNSQWQMAKPWQSIHQLLVSKTAPRGVSLLTAAATGRSSSSGGSAGGVSLLTAAATAQKRTSAVPKRAPWADAADDVPSQAEKRAKKKSTKKVSFQEEPTQEPQGSPDARFYFVLLACDLDQKVLLRSYGAELSGADTTLLLAVDSKKRSFGVLESTDEEDLGSFTAATLLSCRPLQNELAALEATVDACDSYPPLDIRAWSPLHRVQFLLFLHMWAVVTQDYTFFVSSALLRLIGIPLREQKTYDLFAVIHRYCYIIWLHRTDRPERWSGEALSFLLPATTEWNQWWEQQQVAAQDISEVAFAEEYLLLVADPLAADADQCVKEELGQLKRRLRRSDLVIAPQIPQHYSWCEHDVYVAAEEALPIPRALPCFRCTAGLQETAWGTHSGRPLEVTRQNMVQEVDCCLEVEVPVPRGWGDRTGAARPRVVLLPP